MYQPPSNQPDPNQPQQPPYGQQPPYQQPGQQPYGTPPPQQYPQQPYPQQPMQPPKKKRRGRIGCVVVGVVIVLVVIIAIAASANKGGTTATSGTLQATTAPGTPTAAPKPTVALKWTNTHTFTGNGSKKTETIVVPSDWKILWTCDPASFSNIQYNVIVEVSNSDGTPADPGAINTLCKAGNVSGDTEERQAGNVYLNITSEGAWTFTIQEMK